VITKTSDALTKEFISTRKYSYEEIESWRGFADSLKLKKTIT
jgi:hypothetical protein